MSAPSLVTAYALARDTSLYNLDTKPERWLAGPPFDTLDVRPGRVLLFGAPPGAGKTTLALQLVTDLLARQPALRCVIANVETAAPVLLDKLLSRLAGVDLTALMNREFLETNAGGSTPPSTRTPTYSPGSPSCPRRIRCRTCSTPCGRSTPGSPWSITSSGSPPGTKTTG